MGKLIISPAILLLMCMTASIASAQGKRMQIMSFEAGAGIVNEMLPEESNYIPLPLLIKYSVALNKKNKTNHLFFFHAEQQLHPALVIAAGRQSDAPAYSKETKVEWEGGVNFGFSYRYFFNEYDLMLGLGCGPHYVSVQTRLQANGFIFSDNFFAGIGRNIGKQMKAHIQVRFRHLSNAGLKVPNLGIDNLMLIAGVSKVF